jgi:hypothetical protein
MYDAYDVATLALSRGAWRDAYSQATVCHAERTNLTLRTLTRRFVRRTINFSKKVDNHRHAVALFVAVFNFCRAHKTLGGKTPAMAAGLTDHKWTVEELLSVTI